MSKEKSIFEFGDQDYGSAVGWEPVGMKGGSFSRKLLEEDKKRTPRDYARTPDMLSAMPMSWWVAVGAGYPPMEQLFEPPSLGLSKYRRCAIQKWGCKYLKTRVTCQKCNISPHVVALQKMLHLFVVDNGVRCVFRRKK